MSLDTPETAAPGQPIGCYGQDAGAHTKKVLTDRLVRLKVPRIGDSEDAFGWLVRSMFLLVSTN